MQGPGGGLFGTLEHCYRKARVGETLVTSVKAVGLATFAHHTHDSELAIASRFQYLQAIRLTNAALANLDEAVKDSTLACIIILGLYEMLTGYNQRSLEAWAEHIHGAAALLKLRGDDQFLTEEGIDLYFQTTTGLLTSCIQRSISLPEYIVQTTYKLNEMDNFRENSAFQVHVAMLEANQFRARTKDGMKVNAEDIVTQALECDQSLASMCSNPPDGWGFLPSYSSQYNPAIIFRGRCDVYNDSNAIYLWNAARIIRILLHQRIRELLLRGFASVHPTFTQAEHTAQYQRSTDICYEMQADLLASMPQQLGYMEQVLSLNVFSAQIKDFLIGGGLGSSDDGNDVPVSSVVASMAPHLSEASSSTTELAFTDLTNDIVGMRKINDVPAIRPSTGFMPLWPLWFAGYMDLATEEVQTYCISNLRRIGRDVGLYQAFLLAKVLEDRATIKVWDESRKFETL